MLQCLEMLLLGEWVLIPSRTQLGNSSFNSESFIITFPRTIFQMSLTCSVVKPY